MAVTDKTLDPLILEAAKKEFLEKGYQKATLRDICKSAGVTTGALYKRYANKDELFRTIIEPVVQLFAVGQDEAIERSDSAKETGNLEYLWTNGEEYYRQWMYVFYRNYDALKLLLCCASGSIYENYMESYLEQMTDKTMGFAEAIYEQGQTEKIPDRDEMHILLTAWWECLLEPIRHDFPEEKGMKFCTTINQLFNWQEIFGF